MFVTSLEHYTEKSMHRRSVLKDLIVPTAAVGIAGAALSSRAQAQTCVQPCFAQSQAELAVSVIPVSTQYPEGHVFRYMTQTEINDVLSVPFTTATKLNVSAALNNAFKVPGITVTLHAGNYLCSSGLMVPKCAEIVGSGWNSTIIGVASGVTGVFLQLDNVSNQRMRGFKLQGLGAPNATGMAVGAGAMTSNVHLQDIWIEGFTGSSGVGLALQDVVTLLFQNCYICLNKLNVSIGGSPGLPTTVQFVGGAIRTATTQGVKVTSGSSIRFSGTVFESNANEGIYAQTASGHVIEDLLIEGNCWFEDNWHGYPDTGSRVYDVVIDGTAGYANLVVSNARFSHGTNPTGGRKSLHVKRAMASLHNMRCYYGFPYEIVVEGGAASYVQFVGDSTDRMARFVANLDGVLIVYPTYRPLVDNGNGTSTLP